jgi:hypothetical protein
MFLANEEKRWSVTVSNGYDGTELCVSVLPCETIDFKAKLVAIAGTIVA